MSKFFKSFIWFILFISKPFVVHATESYRVILEMKNELIINARHRPIKLATNQQLPKSNEYRALIYFLSRSVPKDYVIYKVRPLIRKSTIPLTGDLKNDITLMGAMVSPCAFLLGFNSQGAESHNPDNSRAQIFFDNVMQMIGVDDGEINDTWWGEKFINLSKHATLLSGTKAPKSKYVIVQNPEISNGSSAWDYRHSALKNYTPVAVLATTEQQEMLVYSHRVISMDGRGGIEDFNMIVRNNKIDASTRGKPNIQAEAKIIAVMMKKTASPVKRMLTKLARIL